MCQAALGELDLETVLALRRRGSQRRFGSLAEGALSLAGLPVSAAFGFRRAPGFCAHAAKRNAGMRDIAARNREHHRRRREGELIRRAIAELQVDLLAFGQLVAAA